MDQKMNILGAASTAVDDLPLLVEIRVKAGFDTGANAPVDVTNAARRTLVERRIFENLILILIHYLTDF